MSLELMLIVAGLLPLALAGVSTGAEDVETAQDEPTESHDWQATFDLMRDGAAGKGTSVLDTALSELEAQDAAAEGIVAPEFDDTDQDAAPSVPVVTEIDDFDAENDVLVVQYTGDVAPEVEAQDVTESGLSVSLSDGTLVALVGMTVVLAADRIAFVRAVDAKKAEMDVSAA